MNPKPIGWVKTVHNAGRRCRRGRWKGFALPACSNRARKPAPSPNRACPRRAEEVAKLFPQLEILGFLGKGGMGAV